MSAKLYYRESYICIQYLLIISKNCESVILEVMDRTSDRKRLRIRHKYRRGESILQFSSAWNIIEMKYVCKNICF